MHDYRCHNPKTLPVVIHIHQHMHTITLQAIHKHKPAITAGLRLWIACDFIVFLYWCIQMTVSIVLGTDNIKLIL